MLEVAVTSLKLSPNDFWNLSWPEWSLYVKRLEKEQEDKRFLLEEQRDMTRIILAAIYNSQGGKKGGGSFKGSDFISIPSRDGADEKQEDFDFDTLVNRWGRTIKKKNGDK